MKAKSFVTVTDRRAKASELFEERLKKKMSESANSTVHKVPLVPHLPAIITVEKNSEHSVSVLGASLIGEMNDSDSSESESMKMSSNDRDRLANNMIESMKMPPSARDRLDEKVRARKAVEERLKKKMGQSAAVVREGPSTPPRPPVAVHIGPSKPSMRRRPKLSAKEFEERLKKKMIESSSVVPTSPVKSSPANDSFEQRLKKNKSESSLAMPMDPSNPKPVMLPSNAIPDKSNVKGSLVHSRKLTAKESFEERLKKKMNESADSERSSNNSDRLEKKIRAKKAVEDRLKREMGGHEEVPSEKSTSPIESRNISVKESTIQKKMSESADIGRSSNNSDRLESKIRARKAVEDRLKRRMAGHAEELSEKSTAAKESSIEIQRRKMKEFELNVAERQGRNTPPAKGDSVGQTGLCVICHEFSRSHLFVPCGHMCVCLRCSDRVMERTCKCPMCSETVMMVTRVRNSKLN